MTMAEAPVGWCSDPINSGEHFWLALSWEHHEFSTHISSSVLCGVTHLPSLGMKDGDSDSCDY